jgi:bacillopeptidase F (M6 metalloprotease family)
VRDVIWTVIILWVVWKVYDAFKNVSKARTQTQSYGDHSSRNNAYNQKEGEVKVDMSSKPKTHFKPDDGEYVDYEEIK